MSPETTTSAWGQASVHGTGQDLFTQPAAVEVLDLVLTVDRSPSMADDAASLVSNLASLGALLPSLGADLHAVVVVADHGCVVGSSPWIDGSYTPTESLLALLEMADLDQDLSAVGASTDEGFSLVRAALDQDRLAEGGCNAGLLREEATLVVAHVSDGPEQSGLSHSDQALWLRDLKGDASLLRTLVASGDYPGGCGTAAAGTGYYELVGVTGGAYLSICDPAWGADLYAQLHTLVQPDGAFVLSQEPVPATLQVSVDSLALEEGWSYDADHNAVIFDEVPQEGAEITVDYTLVPPDCRTW